MGATGGIGQYLVGLALANGHQVTAYVRSPEKVGLARDRMEVIRGDVFNTDQMARSMAGHDAVLSAFGPMTVLPSTLRREFGRTLAAAMRQGSVHRLELVSAAFLFREVGFFGRFLKATLFRQMIPDMAGMEIEVCQSDLDWTIVRPPRLSNGPVTGTLSNRRENLPKGGFLVSRADVAHFMIGEAENPSHLKRIVGVAK